MSGNQRTGSTRLKRPSGIRDARSTVWHNGIVTVHLAAVAAAPSELGFPEQLLLGIGVAVAASVLTLAGNWLIQRSQSRAVVRSELREFVRAMHLDTVATVADLDLFMREIRASVLTGMKQRPGSKLTSQELVEAEWDGGLLRRVRLLRFGHPDPDVRLAAEQMEDAMWPYVTSAVTERKDVKDDARRETLDYADNAMRLLRTAVWNAPRRDVPRRYDYDGSNRMSYLERSRAGLNSDGSRKSV